MEVHLVHQDAQGNLAVVGILLDRGSYNSLLDPVWGYMPLEAGSERVLDAHFDVGALIPDDARTYRYPGSLTTPPCTEGVQWLLLTSSVEVSPAQAQVFKDIVGYNSRYVQPRHGREVMEDSSADR